MMSLYINQIQQLMIYTSSLYHQFKQAFSMSNVATFWFGGILSAIETYNSFQIFNDLDSAKFCELIKIINNCLVDALVFYQSSNETDQFFKLLLYCQKIVFESEHKEVSYSQIQIASHNHNQSEVIDYNLILAKISLKNSLVVYNLKLKQINLAMRLAQQIWQQYQNSKIDKGNQVFLAGLNNYLHILNKGKDQLSKKEVERSLQQAFNIITQKIMTYENISSQLLDILVSIFIQNSLVLKRFQNVVNLLLLNFQSNSIQRSQKDLSNFANSFFVNKILKKCFFRLELRFYEFWHSYTMEFMLKKWTQQKRNQQKTQKIEQKQQKKFSKIQKMLQKSLNLLSQKQQINISNKFRRLSNYNNSTSRNSNYSTIEVSSFTNQQSIPSVSIQNFDKSNSLSKTIELKSKIISEKIMASPPKQQLIKLSPIKKGFQQKKTKIQRHKIFIFKIGSIFIEVNQDGILLSDYTKQNKRYIQWNTISKLFLRFQYKFIFEEYLKYPIANYYDTIRILRLYLSKTEAGNIALFQNPNILLEINEFLKLYRQDGNYTKIVLMNRYDNSKLVGSVDCYLQQFDHFFKVVSKNEYINWLNSKVIDNLKDNQEKTQQIFYLDLNRKKLETTKNQLENQLSVDMIQEVINQKISYKAIFILKNNVKIYCKIKVHQQKTSKSFEILVKRLQQNSPQQWKEMETRSIQLNFHHILSYIPIYNLSQQDYIVRYGRIIFDMFNNFHDVTEDLNLSGLNFQIIVYGFKQEMIQIGKYFTTVSAQLIGSKNQIIGLVIRYHFLPANINIITLLINPYQGFLKKITILQRQEISDILNRLLINSSVKNTYQWLQKNQKLNQISSLLDYLQNQRMI